MRAILLLYLEDILRALNDIENFVEGLSYEEFKQSKKTLYAVIKAFNLIVEAILTMPYPIREAYPEVPSQDLKAMRKRFSSLFGINFNILWETIKEDVPEKKIIIQQIIDNYKDSED